jgi:hypothetical protein
VRTRNAFGVENCVIPNVGAYVQNDRVLWHMPRVIKQFLMLEKVAVEEALLDRVTLPFNDKVNDDR